MSNRISCLFAAALLLGVPAARAGSNPISNPTNWAWNNDGDDDQESKADKEQDLYDEGTDALDDHQWARAVKYFEKVATMKMSHAAAALYFKSTAQAEMGDRSAALATLVELQQSYAKSKWAEDGKALELEIRQKVGQHIEPKHVDDEELKLMALNGLMQSDPERAVPVIESIINSNQSAKLKDRALFVLSQSSSPRAMEILARIAKTGPPDMQSRAIRYLGIGGGSRTREVLADVYNGTANTDVKRAVLKAYMISGDRSHLLALAKGESNADLRAEAVLQLGLSGGRSELAELYSSEPTLDVKKKILQAMFLGGNAEKLGEIARTERNADLKTAAIHNLGLMGPNTGSILVQLYQSDTREDVRRAVIQGLFLQNNGKALVDLARQEKDRELKQEIVSKLSIMHSKEATDYLMEFLRE